MPNNYLIILCLLALYSCTYKPMTQKTFNFGGDVCYYKDVSHNLNFKYVKPCESGKACVSLEGSDYSIKKCLNSEFLPRTLNDDCNYDEDCPETLVCSSSKKCSFDGDTPYNNYCPEGKVVDRTDNKCKEKTNGDKCEMTDDNGVPNADVYFDDTISPSYFRVCGLIELKKKTTEGIGDHYFKKSLSKSFYCSAPDDSFVEDKFVCESGFALYFYGNKEYKSSNNPYNNQEKMFLRCVTVTGIDKEKNIIKYRIGDGSEQYYHIEEVVMEYKHLMEESINDLTMTKLEMFQNYKKRYDQIKEECKSLLYLDELKTCRDDELRKWKYFYDHPNNYILYQNEPQIMEFLIQEEYKDYKAEHTTDSIGFLNINILLIFFILISL